MATTAAALDQSLMLSVKAGEVECFSPLFRKYRGPIVQYLYRMVNERESAEELAQEVFLRIYHSRLTYEATARFNTWIYRIATNLALNWLRDRRNSRNCESLDAPRPGRPLQIGDRKPNVEQQLVREARIEEVRRAVARLPERQRAALLMHRFEELEYREIAVALGCSIPTVKSLLFRAYTTLRERLAYLDREPLG